MIGSAVVVIQRQSNEEQLPEDVAEVVMFGAFVCFIIALVLIISLFRKRK